jgi:WD40 repeat protein/serine/threonine protein kinase
VTERDLAVPAVPARNLTGRMLGAFRLGARLGTGSYGDVYRSEHVLLERPCVVKVLREDRHYRARERFLREARLASRLDHPHAAHIYDYGFEPEVDSDNYVAWLAMELVDGVTLTDWLRAHGPMSLEEFVPAFEALADALQAAHDAGIIHRDVKPDNIMVIERAGRRILKLIDFGIAKQFVAPQPAEPPSRPAGSLAEDVDGKARTAPTAPIRPKLRERTETYHGPRAPSRVPHEQLTNADTLIGSFPYMAPEMWRSSRDVGPEVDLYALGVVAYKMLSGRAPFHGASTGEWKQLHQHAPVPPLGVPDLDLILSRAMAKHRADRQGSVTELAAEFGAVLRTRQRAHLHVAAQTWKDRGRSSRLLWGAGQLADFERTRGAGILSDLECAFIEASQRRARQLWWWRRGLVALLAVGVFCVFQHYASMRAQLAEEQVRRTREVTEATRTQAELEQGRSAGLHAEPEAWLHLAAAYQRDRSPSTAFMLARALQPRLAEQAVLPASRGRMWSATFSPDGRQIVTADDSAAQVWDAGTHQLRFTLAHGDIVYQAIYAAGGKRILTACGDGGVRIWDAASGALVRELRREGPKPRYGAVAALPDGRAVAAIDIKGDVVNVWDATTGGLLAELRSAGMEYFGLAFSADGRWLAAVGGDNVRVYDVRTWSPVNTFAGHRLSWDPTGPRLVTGGDGGVSLWAIPSGERLHHLRDLGAPVSRVAVSPNGHLIVAGTEDGAELVWTAAGKLQSQGNYLHGQIYSVEFDPTSTLVVAASSSGSVVISDALQGMPVAVLDGARKPVRAAHFDPSARLVVSASWDGTARVWDATAPYRRWRSPTISDEDCGLLTSLEPDQRFVAIGCRAHPTQVWDTSREQMVAELPSVTPGEGGFAGAYPAVSKSGDLVAIARGSTVAVYAVPGGRLVRTIVHGAPVNAVAFATTGHDIVSGAVDGSLIVTRENGAQLVLPASRSGIDAAGFLPDGRVVVADAQRHLRVYDPGGARVADLETSGHVRMLRMSSDGRRLLTVPNFIGKAEPLDLWDVESYRRLAQLCSVRWRSGSDRGGGRYPALGRRNGITSSNVPRRTTHSGRCCALDRWFHGHRR